MKAYLSSDLPNPEALNFNSKFINNVINSNTPIYDMNRSGYSIFYNSIERSTIGFRNYFYNVTPVRSYTPFSQPNYGYYPIRIPIW